MKSDRLRRLEKELIDLEQWLKLGLVPKKDLEKHKEEIRLVQDKIREETDRLAYLKENAETEDLAVPRKGAGRTSYGEPASMPDVDISEEVHGVSDTSIDMETETVTNSVIEEKEDAAEEGGEEEEEKEEEEEDPFSEKNRWRRGMMEADRGIQDPDANEW